MSRYNSIKSFKIKKYRIEPGNILRGGFPDDKYDQFEQELITIYTYVSKISGVKDLIVTGSAELLFICKKLGLKDLVKSMTVSDLDLLYTSESNIDFGKDLVSNNDDRNKNGSKESSTTTFEAVKPEEKVIKKPEEKPEEKVIKKIDITRYSTKFCPISVTGSVESGTQTINFTNLMELRNIYSNFELDETK